MPRTLKHYMIFDQHSRDKLEALYNAKVPVKQIAVELGFTFQSIYRELKRGLYPHTNTDLTITYRYSAYKAELNHKLNSTAKGAPIKLGNDKDFAEFVEVMILKGYSPQAILYYIQENNLNFKTKVCRATIYSYIDKGVFLHISNKDLLRKGKMKKKRKKKTVKQLPRFNSIEKRPIDVSLRSSFGHWELDSVIGTKNKGQTILTMTERKTRMEFIFRSSDKSSVSTVKVLNSLERKLGMNNFRKMFKTITVDNGTEFANYEAMEISPYHKKRRTTIYYCHPFCSSERGSNENQNGFIRRFIPKGRSISSYSDVDLQYIQDFINLYPRHIFNGKNSLMLFNLELEKLNIKNFYKKIHSTT